MLLEGESLQVLAETKDAVREMSDTHKGWGEINYFKNNIERMNYSEYRDLGFPIGSGVVESAAKQIGSFRLKRAGARWTELGARFTAKAVTFGAVLGTGYTNLLFHS